MSTQNDNQSQYKITQAYITSEGMGGDNVGDRVNVNSSIVELVFFESLEKPYISGQVAITDDQGFVDGIGFSGTERLFIEIASEDKTLLPIMSRTFIMTSIDRVIKSNDAGKASIYLFTIMDEHAFLSKSKKISRTVTGTLEREIQKICGQDLKKDIDISYLYPSVQNNMKVIIPYLHPLEACEWLRDRATTTNGCPFFLYASIHDTNLRLGSLDKMLEQDPWNDQIPYLYSPSNVKQTEGKSPMHRTFQIQTMRTAKMQNTLTQMMAGGVGSAYNNTNLNTGQISSKHFSITRTIDTLKKNGIIPSEKEQNIYPTEFEMDDKTIHEQDAKVYHQITSTGTYGTFKSYHDEVKQNSVLTKLDNISIRNMLLKNQFEITVPGAGFIVSKASVGDIVTIQTISDNMDNESTQAFDNLRTGDFLIYNTRHTFKDTRHDVVMSVCKLVRG
jgi:hypothetical protein